MKVERKKAKAFIPVTITLETQAEVQYMNTIACVQINQTLKECCKTLEQPHSSVDGFGADLARELDDFLDC